MEQNRGRRAPARRIWAAVMAAVLFCVLGGSAYYLAFVKEPPPPQTAQTDPVQTPPGNALPPDEQPAVPAEPEDNPSEPDNGQSADNPALPAGADQNNGGGASSPNSNSNSNNNGAGNGNNSGGGSDGGGSVSIIKENAEEDIVIRTPEKNIGMEVASWQVDYTDDDSALTVTGVGVADLAAREMLEKLKDSDYISDVYPAAGGGDQITVVLKEPARLEIYGGVEPDEVVMRLTKPEKEKIYVLRTNAYESEDALSVWKERLGSEPLTVKGDAENGYYLETDSFTTKEEAENKLQEILAAGDMDLFVEERETGRILNAVFIDALTAATVSGL
jgi:hypothetical protein